MPRKSRTSVKKSHKSQIKKFSQEEIDNLKKDILGLKDVIDKREAELKGTKEEKKEEEVMGAKILYFESSNTAKLINKKITDGQIDLGDRTHIVDTSDPIMLKKGRWPFTSFEPMFILKHDEIHPAKNLNPIRPEFAMRDKKGKIIKDKVNPEVLKKTMSMKILGNMLKTRRSMNPLMLVIIGLAMGGFIIYYLIAMKVIKI